MDSGAFDVVGVGDSADDVFGRGYATPLRIGGVRGGCVGGRYIFRVDDADFGGAEFAQIADEGCQGHSLAFSVGTFTQQ